MLEGTCHIVGLPFSEIDGDAHDQKIKTVKEFTGNELLTIVKDKGFSMHVLKDTLIAIPGDCIIIDINTSDHSVHGVRWSLLGPLAAMEHASDTLMNLNFSYGAAIGKDVPAIIQGLRITQLFEGGNRLWKFN